MVGGRRRAGAGLDQRPRARGEPRGPGWTACVRAELDSAMGRPLGTQTYRITISGGAIIDRRRVEAADSCGSESFEPI